MSGPATAVATSKFQQFMNHPAGPKTVHFWAPAFKWGLVFAGLGDLERPVDKISVSQTTALAATGLIWSRYSLVITPVNYSLFSVNLFVAATNCYQLFRVYTQQPTTVPVIAPKSAETTPVPNQKSA